jgi:hypothetical protein
MIGFNAVLNHYSGLYSLGRQRLRRPIGRYKSVITSNELRIESKSLQIAKVPGKPPPKDLPRAPRQVELFDLGIEPIPGIETTGIYPQD